MALFIEAGGLGAEWVLSGIDSGMANEVLSHDSVLADLDHPLVEGGAAFLSLAVDLLGAPAELHGKKRVGLLLGGELGGERLPLKAHRLHEGLDVGESLLAVALAADESSLHGDVQVPVVARHLHPLAFGLCQLVAHPAELEASDSLWQLVAVLLAVLVQVAGRAVLVVRRAPRVVPVREQLEPVGHHDGLESAD